MTIALLLIGAVCGAGALLLWQEIGGVRFKIEARPSDPAAVMSSVTAVDLEIYGCGLSTLRAVWIPDGDLWRLNATATIYWDTDNSADVVGMTVVRGEETGQDSEEG